MRSLAGAVGAAIRVARAARGRHPRAMASTLIGRRIGRITFGGVLLAGLAYLVVALSSRVLHHGTDTPSFGAAPILGATWAVALIAGALARGVASRTRRRYPPDALFAASLVVPTVGIALVLPLTIHMPFALLVGGGEAFDFWVMVSVGITGFTHLVFAWASATRAHQLVRGRLAWTPRRIYVLTLISSCVPFIIIWAIPPVLVAVTALPFLPMLRSMEHLVERERAQMALAPHVLPRAIAMARSA